jgi:hypothetical protein
VNAPVKRRAAREDEAVGQGEAAFREGLRYAEGVVYRFFAALSRHPPSVRRGRARRDCASAAPPSHQRGSAVPTTRCHWEFEQEPHAEHQEDAHGQTQPEERQKWPEEAAAYAVVEGSAPVTLPVR